LADDRLAELRDLHSPPMDLSAMVAEALAALAIGLVLAWAIAGVIRALTARRIPPATRALRRLDTVAAQAGAEGLAARAAILQDYAAGLDGEGDDWLGRLDAHFGGLFSDGAGKGLREALYRPGARFDLGRFDADLRAALGRAAR
jgi:hypothetical protein